jgi:beta-galactosidase
MVAQNRNHPCVFAWSLFNEIYNDVPEDRAEEGWMEDILEEVRGEIKRMDPSRPVVAASDRPARRRLNDLPDQLAFNAYPGWYGDTTIEEDMANWFNASGRDILGISEYGAGGNPFEHLDPLPAGRLDPGGPVHPEETQVRLHAADYSAIAQDGRIWGSFVWAMFDFAADARREGGKNGINDKGLVTRDRSVRKDAFYFYKANWSKEPVLHVCSQRMAETTNAAVTVVGFSSCGDVTLLVNGHPVGTQTPDQVKVVTWTGVPLAEGENVIILETADGARAVRRIVRSTR